ncbi:MAG: T9SS type A sorting domain-containing protein [Bacteroidota bacterium]
MNRFLLLLTLGAFVVVSALPATAQSRPEIEMATVAPDGPRAASQTPIVEVSRIDEGITYGMHNRNGPENDCYGAIDPNDDFTAACIENYPSAAFAGTIVTTEAGEGLFYYVDGTGPGAGGDLQDSLGVYNFDTMEEGELLPVTYFDADGNELPAELAPQWADAGYDTSTGEMILLGRFQACSADAGGQLWSLNIQSREARPLLTFTDPDACPLSMAYDNENNRVIGMVPDAGFEGFYQIDLTTGETVAVAPIPLEDLSGMVVAPFIQGGATNFFDNDDPSDNEAWIFLFEGPNGGPDPNASSSHLMTFDENGIINGSMETGIIDAKTEWVEVLATGFRTVPFVIVSNESGVATGALEFIGVFPNPFQSSAAVMLRANEPVANATVKAYDVLGRQVATLHDGPLAATQHQFGLQARDLPSGVYFVSVRSGDSSQTKKVVLVD